MMTKSRNDVLYRTKSNLTFIQGKETKEGPFAVTQLVNSFLMTLLQNWDEMEIEWPHLRQTGVAWPKVCTSEPSLQARQCIGKIRDALAHGCFAFEGPDDGEIEALHLWTCQDRTTVDWDMTITVEDMEKMLQCFIELANRTALREREPKKLGEPCN